VLINLKRFGADWPGWHGVSTSTGFQVFRAEGPKSWSATGDRSKTP